MANCPHADEGGVDGVQNDAGVMSVGLEADVIVGHGAVGTVDSSHSADVFRDDLVAAPRYSLMEGGVPPHGLKVTGLADHVVVQNSHLFPVHPCGALDDSCGVVIAGNCLLSGAGPSSGDKLLGGIRQAMMEGKVAHSSRELFSKLDRSYYIAACRSLHRVCLRAPRKCSNCQ